MPTCHKLQGILGETGLGFAKEGWRRIGNLSALDLRAGAVFRGENAGGLHLALREAAETIAKMPATYMTYPGTADPILKVTRRRARQPPDALLIDEPFLRSFGEVLTPLHLWRALSRFDAWIEPALVAEWQTLMEAYAATQGRQLDPVALAVAMRWSNPLREVAFVRQIAGRLMERQTLHCIWTGRRLSPDRLDIDHCMPWAAWPCDDLWNLLPADPNVNRHKKRQRLPSASALERSMERILEWWSEAYIQRDEATSARFSSEAAASLALPRRADPSLEDVFGAAQIRRMSIRSDQQVEEWAP